MIRSLSRTKNYDQDFLKNAKNKIEVHYLSVETKISTTKHEQHYEIHSEFKP
jgi:uncharacterized GH25 family protein